MCRAWDAVIQVQFASSSIDIFRRIKLGWQAFGKHSIVLKSNMPINLKKTVYDQCALPVLTYGCETWPLNRLTKGKLRTAQRAMERSITKVEDILQKTTTLKWQWAGHVAQTKNERWTNGVGIEFKKSSETKRKTSRSLGQRYTHTITAHAWMEKHRGQCKSKLSGNQLLHLMVVEILITHKFVMRHPMRAVQLYSTRDKATAAGIFWIVKCVVSDYSAASCDGVEDVFRAMFCEGVPDDFCLKRTKFSYLLTFAITPCFRQELCVDLAGVSSASPVLVQDYTANCKSPPSYILQ
ncbi:hypothetical protein PR048_027581 [Dryococelus australis]|uniref:Uncharacterized protein n=1 Tax=Dryococelus australis TaxID=614101 RepID=A0ABQ9GGX0_9NEOP|nr:hypothetical protein PR048_027581 [Dryococelus australis]